LGRRVAFAGGAWAGGRDQYRPRPDPAGPPHEARDGGTHRTRRLRPQPVTTASLPGRASPSYADSPPFPSRSAAAAAGALGNPAECGRESRMNGTLRPAPARPAVLGLLLAIAG